MSDILFLLRLLQQRVLEVKKIHLLPCFALYQTRGCENMFSLFQVR